MIFVLLLIIPLCYFKSQLCHFELFEFLLQIFTKAGRMKEVQEQDETIK